MYFYYPTTILPQAKNPTMTGYSVWHFIRFQPEITSSLRENFIVQISNTRR